MGTHMADLLRELSHLPMSACASCVLFFFLTVQHTAAAAAKSLQSCPTLYNTTDGSPPGSSVPGILQARTLEWVAISFSGLSSYKGTNLIHEDSTLKT